MAQRYNIKETTTFAAELLEKVGVASERSQRIARALTEVEAFGVTTHGLTVLVAYVNMIKKGNLPADGSTVKLHEFGALTTLDASKVPGV